MPSTEPDKKFFDGESFPVPVGAGGEPSGELPAPPPSDSPLSVDLLPSEVRDRLSDELIDELLAGARTEEEIVGPGGPVG